MVKPEGEEDAYIYSTEYKDIYASAEELFHQQSDMEREARRKKDQRVNCFNKHMRVCAS